MWLRYDRRSDSSEWWFLLALGKKNWSFFQKKIKKVGMEFCLCGLKTLLEFILMVFYCLTKANWFFLLTCVSCTETRGRDAFKHIHVSNQAVAKSGRAASQLFMKLVTPYLPLPCLCGAEDPGAPSIKRKGRLAIHSDIKGPLATTLLAETLKHFNRILRKLLGQTAFGKFTDSWWRHL